MSGAVMPADTGVPERLVRIAGLLALLLPALIAYDGPPSRSALNQHAALAGWGLFCAAVMVAIHPGATLRGVRGLPSLLGALAVMAAACVLSMWQRGFPPGLGLSSLGFLAAAGLCACVGASAARSGAGERVFAAFCAGLLAAGIVSAALGLVQLFAPRFIDGFLVAIPLANGRIGGNLRQPNHLSSLLVASMAALIWLDRRSALAGIRRGWPSGAGASLVAWGLLTVATAATASRTGTVCVLMLALWALLDRDLPRRCRGMLVCLPVLYAFCWWALQRWAAEGAHGFVGHAVLATSDVSSSRFAAWSNVIDLIAMTPWTGVGWGEFNLAWTLTAFPVRPHAMFDHTHNLVLQWLVELGLPAGLVVIGLVMAALGMVMVATVRALPTDRPMVRCALVMLAMIGAHSLLEYPLWYAYFLLPTAFVFGLALGARRSFVTATPRRIDRAVAAVLGSGALLLTAAGVFAAIDYRKALAIYDAEGRPALLKQRLEEGLGSWFFAPQAELAAVLLTGEAPTDPRQYGQVRHLFLDHRVLIAWSQAYAAHGDIERARYLAQRVREFPYPGIAEFFAPCRAEPPVHPRPYQCEPPTTALSFADFQNGAVPAPAPRSARP